MGKKDFRFVCTHSESTFTLGTLRVLVDREPGGREQRGADAPAGAGRPGGDYAQGTAFGGLKIFCPERREPP